MKNIELHWHRSKTSKQETVSGFWLEGKAGLVEKLLDDSIDDVDETRKKKRWKCEKLLREEDELVVGGEKMAQNILLWMLYVGDDWIGRSKEST